MRGRRGRLADISIGLAAFAVLWGVLEGAANLYYERRIRKDLSYELSERYEDKPEIFEGGRVDERGRGVLVSSKFPTRYYTADADRQNNTLLAEKPPHGARVFVYGESSAAGSPWGPWASFARSLEEQLKALARPGVDVEVMNFGVSAIASDRAALLVEWTMEDAPDLVIVYLGHNEICERRPIGSGAGRWSGELERRSMVYRVLRLKLARRPPWPAEPFAAAVCDDVPILTEDEKRRLTDDYAQNIDLIIHSARRAGAVVVLMSQVSNMLMPPGGAHNEAALRFHEGLSALKRGDGAVARRLLADAVDLDDQPRRFRTAQKEVLAARADARGGVYFVDSARHVTERAEHGILDGRFVIDLVHPNVTTQKLLAESLLTGFFLRERWKKDSFDYSRYDSRLLWRWKPSTAQYFMACERYFRESVPKGSKTVDPRVCLAAARADLDTASDVDEQRRARRLWEFLWVYGNDRKDRQALAEAQRLLATPSLWERVEPGIP